MKLYIAAVAGNLGMVSVGLFFGWASPSLSHLKAPDSPVPVTNEQFSWIASLFTFGATVGAVLSVFIVNVIGRKWTMLFTVIPSVVGWLIIAFATSSWELCVSRFISGLASGIAYSATPTYLGEIAPPKVRGILTSMLTVAAKFGALVEFTIGPFLSVRNLALVSLTMPILFAVSFATLPETPYYLVRRDRRGQAAKSLLQLRGKRKDIMDELQVIEKSVKADLQHGSGFKDILLNAGNRRALTIAMGLIMAQQLSGSQAVTAYAQTIFEAADIGLEGKYLAIILGSVQVTSTIVCASIVDRYGRRPLLIVSSVGSALSTGLVGLFFYLRDVQVDTSSVQWFPACGCFLYMITFSVGLAAIPFAMLGELFPTNVKALSSTVALATCNFCSFAVTVAYQPVAEELGEYVMFWLFSLFSLAGALFTVCYVPETKGKTLQQIQAELHRQEK